MVRGCHRSGPAAITDIFSSNFLRHVALLNDLLNKADEGHLVDPTLIHYSFAFCASHVHGNRFSFLRVKCPAIGQWIDCCHCCLRPDGVGTVTLEEKEKFQEVKERLRVLLEKQITNFR